MKKNGFTLVELLSIVVILGIIVVVALPQISGSIGSKKEKQYNKIVKIVENAGKVYLTENVTRDSVSIDKLIESDYLTSGLKNPINNTPLTGCVKKITSDGVTKYKYEVDNCPDENIFIVDHITNLYNDEETRIKDGLKKDNTPDQNIRYYGSNPNNYVLFNNELWRIIGVFGNNVKLVRSESLGKLSWDSSASSVNNGWGVNEWSQADLQVYLNKMYYGGTSVTCYNGENNTTTTCPTNTLDEISKSLIDYHTWNTGAPNDSNITMESYDTLAFYQTERGSVNGKNCTGGKYCNDRVKRTTTWTGYVALPYITDWAYASGEYICETNMNDGVRLNVTGYQYKYTCGRNNWMNRSGETWYLSPFVNAAYACAGCYLSGVGGYEKYAGYAWANVGGSHAAGNATFFSSLFFPTIYLKSNILIESGKGTSDNPYILKAGS